MLREKHACLGDRVCPSTTIHDQITKLGGLLYDVLHPDSFLLLRTDQQLERIFRSSCGYTGMLDIRFSTQKASSSPLQERHIERYQSHPRRVAPFARRQWLIRRRLFGLASCFACSVGNGREIRYRTTMFAHRKPFLLLYLNYFDFSIFYNLLLIRQ